MLVRRGRFCWKIIAQSRALIDRFKQALVAAKDLEKLLERVQVLQTPGPCEKGNKAP